MNEQYAKCIPFDANVKGRIGGNPPQIVENSIPDGYLFYATLVHPEKENRMLSIFIHGDFDTLLQDNIYPLIAVKVIEHEYSEMGTHSEKSIKDLSVNSISDYYYHKTVTFNL